MAKTRLMITVLMMAMVAIANARPGVSYVTINGVKLECRDKYSAIVPEEHNATFLKGVYCGDNSELAEASVLVTDYKESPNYTVAILYAGSKGVVHYYLVTYKPEGGIIDGALVLCKDDIAIAENTVERTRMSAKEHKITLKLDAATVTRNFESFVETGNGGPRISEEGAISMRYDIEKSGKISCSDDGVTQQSTWIVEPNRSIPGNRHDNIDVTKSDKCRTIGMGMNVIYSYTQPVSDEKIVEQLEGYLTLYNSYIKSDEMLVKNEAEKCVMALKDWQKRLMYRDSEPWLVWLNSNQKSNSMDLLKQNLSDDEEFNTWFRNEVKNLGDKKLKKAWEKLLK